MNQRKYLVSAALLLLLVAGIYFIVKKVNNTKAVENSSKVIDDIETSDTLRRALVMGKQLFQNNCASCHSMFKDATGPPMAGVNERWPNKKELFAFIRNPYMIIARNTYARKLKERYGSVMTAFLDLSDNDIQAILDYVKSQEKNAGKPIP